ncbi:hypothetical protein [Streptomyces sp. NPDC088246]|uniref:hypothetical protein n=1 Tax=Streptomyces sp. NPDC088246 TaxID=3365842 RepID=UPI0037F68472
MTHRPDLTRYSYDKSDQEMLNVGWPALEHGLTDAYLNAPNDRKRPGQPSLRRLNASARAALRSGRAEVRSGGSRM